MAWMAWMALGLCVDVQAVQFELLILAASEMRTWGISTCIRSLNCSELAKFVLDTSWRYFVPSCSFLIQKFRSSGAPTNLFDSSEETLWIEEFRNIYDLALLGVLLISPNVGKVPYLGDAAWLFKPLIQLSATVLQIHEPRPAARM